MRSARFPVSFLFSAFLAATAPVVAQTGPGPSHTSDDLTASASWLYGTDGDFAYKISPDTGEVLQIGVLERPTALPELTDIAVTPDGNVYGVTNDNLYKLDGSGIIRRVGDLNLLSSANALASDASGRVFGATSNGTLFEVDLASGRARSIGLFGSSLFSGGDIAFAPDGSLFGISASANLLLRIDTTTGRATPIGTITAARIEGIAFGPDGRLYGAASASRLVVIDTATAAATQVALFAGFRSMTGLAAVPAPPVPPVSPSSPANLRADITGSTITLNWSGVAGAASYVLEAGSASGLTNVFLGDVGPATTLSASAPNGQYFIRVRARTAAGLSGPSNEIVATVGGCAGGAPAAPTALSARLVGSVLTIMWNGTPGATSYQLQAGTGSTLSNAYSANVGATTVLQFNVAGVPRGSYYLRVLAIGGCGISAPSTEVVLQLQ